MKVNTRKITLAGLSAACALTLSLGVGLLAKSNGAAYAESSYTPDSSSFFYDYLMDENGNEYTLAKKFYKALEKMYLDGEFVDGVVDYAINDIVTSEQLRAWVENGNLEVPRAFSAARDAFHTDHPELFYIDLYKMTISVAKSGGAYVGYIDSGREANLYYDNGFNTEADVRKAITAFENKVDEIVNAMNSLTVDKYTLRDAYLAREVNKYLTENIEYDWVALDNNEDPNYIAAAYINTPYGGLVEGKAVCGGYSTSYKVIMEKLGIPCITVNGYSNNRDESGNNSGSSVYHMWNYVYLETPEAAQPLSRSARAVSDANWFSVDVTWNSGASNVNRYSLLSEKSDAELHVIDGAISSSGYVLRYPQLSQYLYGCTGETDGLQVSMIYEPTGSPDDFGNDLVSTYTTISYNGKSAERLLEEDGLYIAYRYAEYEESKTEKGVMEIVWSDWASLEVFRQFLVAFDWDTGMIEDDGVVTRFYGNTSYYYIQFAVFDVKPDSWTATGSNIGDYESHDPETEPYYFFYYSIDLLNDINSVETGGVYINESYGTYTRPPYADITPGVNFTEKYMINDSMGDGKTSKMNPNKAFVISIVYDEPLHILDDSQPIGISYTSDHPNVSNYAYFVAYSDGSYVRLINEYTLEFKFCPSLLYEHNDESYNFFFTNVGSAKLVERLIDGQLVTQSSDKLPNSAICTFSRLCGACPARFNYDGRLWIETCAQPELVANSDLAAMNFLDEDGESTFSENQRSQMMLVAERADTATVDAMLDGIGDIDGSDVTSNDIISSETFDIYLQLCNKYPVIPDGSYVRMSLGFPEGYGPDDEGVTFKLYHRKHIQGDEYVIEEIPCVVTQYGIVAIVTSFSPYMVAVVDEAFATTKNVFASIEGKGGTLTLEDGKIQSLNEGGSYTYTIQPDAGYSVYSVKLNGVEVSGNIVNGKLTLSYNELDMNNQLVIQYIADAAAARIQQKIDSNVIDEAIDVVKYVVALEDKPVYSTAPITTAPTTSTTPNVTPEAGGQPANGSNTMAIVITVVCIVLAAAVLATAAVVIIRRRRS